MATSKKKFYYIVLVIFIFFVTLISLFDASLVLKNFPQEWKDNTKKYYYNLINQNQIKKRYNLDSNKFVSIKEIEKIELNIIKYKKKFLFTLKKDTKNNNSEIYFNSEIITQGPRSYFALNKNTIFLLTGTGILLNTDLSDLKKNEIVFNKIETNILSIIDENYLNKRKTVFVGIEIVNNNIYLSYKKKINKNCYTNAIIAGELNLAKIYFYDFFTVDYCSKSYDNQTGGNIKKINDDEILMATGDWSSYEFYNKSDPQNSNNLIGKIFSINLKTKKTKLISLGHRNPQGLFFDSEDNVIISTEHGPKGGDEININYLNKNKLKNYGWAISSYGEHYDFHLNKKKIYQIAPLFKSHSKYGFEEPLIYFTPSLALSQIIKVKINKNNFYLIFGTMASREGGNSIYKYKMSKDYKILEKDRIKIGGRVRDLTFIKNHNLLLAFIEDLGEIRLTKIHNEK